jgi:hypothetical protein
LGPEEGCKGIPTDRSLLYQQVGEDRDGLSPEVFLFPSLVIQNAGRTENIDP